MEFPLAGS